MIADYSYLRASMGESLLAFRAGATPKMIPTKEETPKARIIDERVILAGKKLLIARAPRLPRIIPMMPPTPERITASMRNWIRIARG